MKLDLELIRNLLRRTLGYESFAAGFINRVTADPEVPTACISAQGVLRYNPDFVREHVKTEADLFCLVFHELLHPAFGHFIHNHDELANLACDAIINAVITTLFVNPSANGCLFRALYPERGLSAILRKGSKLAYSRYCPLYQHLYPDYAHSRAQLSAGEVIQTLKALTPPAYAQVLLLGSHGVPGTEGKPRETWSGKVTREVSKELLAAIKQTGCGAGYCESLINLMVEVLKTKRTIRQDLLLGYTTRKRLDAFFDTQERSRRITSPFPVNPSRRDLVLLSAGIWPGFFRNRQPELIRRQKGVALFLDVSGSVNEFLPQIIGLLSGLRNRLTTIYLFSNKVVEVPFAKLCQGELQTTYGTDFDCVAETVLEKEYERAIILTDGCASLKPENTERLRKAGTRLLTILFDGGEECEAFKPFGEIIQLDQVIDQN